jgi:hypothetical protein
MNKEFPPRIEVRDNNLLDVIPESAQLPAPLPIIVPEQSSAAAHEVVKEKNKGKGRRVIAQIHA